MITISSKAGQRLAKALKALQDAGRAFNVSGEDWGDNEPSRAVIEAQAEFQRASAELGSELIEGNHHLVEGD